MFDFNKTHEWLLKNYTRPIVHMRNQLNLKRFSLVFGSGLSKDFGLPMWSELVEKIAGDAQVQGKKLLAKFSATKSLPYLTELLLQHFKRKRTVHASSVDPNSKAFEYLTLEEWLRIFAKHLYADAPPDFASTVKGHPYLMNYLPIIRQTLMTVNYNFDNYIERALALEKNDGLEKQSRGYETVTNPWMQFQRSDSVIYHPNGVFPPELMELPTDKFVFSEASYAEQFAGALAGDHSPLINHFCKNTCLLIGLSLEDEILRTLLIMSAKASPGNYHYYVYFMNSSSSLREDEREAMLRTNFNVYNLKTLFLNEQEISALGELINPEKVSNDDICDCASTQGIDCAFRFYFTGPMGVGKSTNINNFRNLTVLDEWMEERPAILAKPWDELNPTEQDFADNWIANQFKKKNDNLRHNKVGICILDRSPMDPLAFTPPSEQAAKASNLVTTICPGEAAWKVQNGVVILLTGDPKELEVRLILSGRKEYNADKLDKMEKAMKKIYEIEGVIILDTHGLTIPEVTKRIAEIIHLREYKPCNIHTRLEAFRDRKLSIEI